MVIDLPKVTSSSEKPLVTINVNLDDILKEALSTLRTVHSEIGSIASAVNIHVNQSMDMVGLSELKKLKHADLGCFGHRAYY